ncbi:H-NS histone family protein [Methylomonas sp. AM2-LC]|uniref:H-NS histone family protein n=1 Tax=Methylomonas sp. AM2-LC TaxID=3153301 RepID=UPI0032653B20
MINLNDKSDKELAEILNSAKNQLEENRRAKTKNVVAKIETLAISIGVTVKIYSPGDVNESPSKKVAARFRNPSTNQTWTGRGLAPKWLRALEESGRNREEFIIKK